MSESYLYWANRNEGVRIPWFNPPVMPFGSFGRRTRFRVSRPRYGRFGRITSNMRFRPKIKRRSYRRGNIRSGGVLKPELKWYDRTMNDALTTTLFNVGGNTKALNTMIQGTGEQERIGMRAIIKSVYIWGYIQITGQTLAALVTDGNQMVRLMLFVDHQPNGATFTPGDVLETANDVTSLKNMDQAQRFTVLYNKNVSINLNQSSSTTADRVFLMTKRVPFKIYKKLQFLTSYENTTEAISSISSNALHFAVFMEGANPGGFVVCSTRTRFYG